VRESTPIESLELALIENIHRKDLNPIEEAQAYSKCLEEGRVTQEALAKKLGRERSTITNMLRLLKLPQAIQQDLIDGRMSMGHARVLAGVVGKDGQMALRDVILKRGLSVRQVEELAKRQEKAPKSSQKSPEMDDYIQSLAENLKRALGTKVEIRKKGKQGRIVIHFYSDEELDRLLDLLS